jgi:hypothetical protein
MNATLRLATLLAACVSLAPLAGCGGGTQQATVAMMPEVQWGPARERKPKKVLVLGATCGSVELRCPEGYVEAVDGIVRSGLEFNGYGLVAEGQLLKETRKRSETIDTSSAAQASHSETVEDGTFVFREKTRTDTSFTSQSEQRHIVLDGSLFEDLSVTDRQQVLAAANADSVAVVRIVVGATTGIWTPEQTVQVMVKLGIGEDDQMSFASRCTTASGAFATVNAALESAAQCAVKGIAPY